MAEGVNWTERIISLLLGGGLAGFGTFFIQKRKADNEDFTILKEAYRDEFKRYEEKFDKLNAQYAKLEDRYQRLEQANRDLQKTIQTLKSSFPDLPIPMWLKDHNGIMLSLNNAYEDAFLLPQHKTRNDYIGKHDEEIWGEQVASVFRENDVAAIARKRMSFVIEDELENKLLKGWQFFKYPKYVDGVFIGVGGIALPLEKKVLKKIKK